MLYTFFFTEDLVQISIPFKLKHNRFCPVRSSPASLSMALIARNEGSEIQMDVLYSNVSIL